MIDSLAVPLPQSDEFAATCAAMGQPLRLCCRESHERERLRWQVQSRRLRVFGRDDLISRGPVGEADALQDWPDRWRQWHDGRPMILNAEGMAPDRLRAAGFWPIMTPASIALLPLGEEAEMRAAMAQKWRNRLNAALRAPLKVTRHALGGDHWLLRAEQTQARDKGYRGLPPGVSAAFAAANPGKATVFEARHRGQPVAALLILSHGVMCTWQIGHSTAEGRRLNAMNRLLWAAMIHAAGRGHRVMDLGTLNARDAAGLVHFKLGTGARPHRLGGTWLHLGALAPMARHLPARLMH
ncbi:GNAT family N-acetyltransferase [Ponticoccus alexandrii]|nr:GNAT family N-acetyltransferase [Ponticoccus alexandrii]